MKMKPRYLTLAIGVSLSMSVAAAPVSLIGDNVTYSFDDALLDLFGLPTLLGDSLFFTPTNFKAESNSGGIGFTGSTMNIKVEVNDPAKWIGNVSLKEAGDYLLWDPFDLGVPKGVGVSGQIRVRSLNDLNEVTDPIVASAPLTNVVTGFSAIPTSNWSASAAADVNSWMASAVNVTVQNLLLAATAGGPALAFIEKKGVVLQVTAVPEPETWAMLLAGLGLVGLQLRRKMKNADKISLN